MFGWLKNLFGGKKKTDPVVVKTAPAPAEAPKKEEPKVEQAKPAPAPKAAKAAPAKKTTKKTTKKAPVKKAEKADLDSMSKNDLLAHAKANGIKANASMKKADILAAIKKG